MLRSVAKLTCSLASRSSTIEMNWSRHRVAGCTPVLLSHAHSVRKFLRVGAGLVSPMLVGLKCMYVYIGFEYVDIKRIPSLAANLLLLNYVGCK